MMSKKCIILFHAREAGAATMIKAMVPGFESHGYQPIYDIDNDAKPVLGDRKQGFIEDADLIVCGYDSALLDRTGDFLSQKKKETPVIGILDSWKGVDRFWYPDGRMRQMPDRLAVPDHEIEEYLLSRGVEAHSIFVSGHPVLEHFQQYPTQQKQNQRESGRKTLGFGEKEPILVLMSEPLKKRNEQSISLLETRTLKGESLIHWILKKYARDYRLCVRFHPIEPKVKTGDFIDISQMDFETSLSLADIVIGLASTTLAYAVAFGLKVRCLDQVVKDWQPEQSDIPSSLWNKLISAGVFQNDRERIKKKKSTNHLNSSLKVITEAESLLRKARI